MAKRPTESSFGLLTGVATMYNTLQTSKLRKEKTRSDSHISYALQNMHSEILDQSITNQFGIEQVLESQVRNMRNMAVIGGVMDELLKNQKNHISYQLSKDAAEKLFGHRKNLLLDLEEQYYELQQLSKTYPEQACLLSESLVEICKENGLTAENFDSGNISDLREVRAVLKKVMNGPKEIKANDNWSEGNYNNLKLAYEFLVKYPQKIGELQDKVLDSDKRLSLNKRKIETHEKEIIKQKSMLDDFSGLIVSEEIYEQKKAEVKKKISRANKEMREIHTTLNKRYFFRKRRTFPEGERRFMRQYSLLSIQSEKTTFFRTQRFLDEEFEQAKKEPNYIEAESEYDEAYKKEEKLSKKLKSLKLELEHSEEFQNKVNKIKNEIQELEKELKISNQISSKIDSQLLEFLNLIDSLNSTLKEKEDIVSELSPSNHRLE